MSARGRITSDGRDTRELDRSSSSTLTFAMDSDRDNAHPPAQAAPPANQPTPQAANPNQPHPQTQHNAPPPQGQQPQSQTILTPGGPNSPSTGAPGSQSPVLDLSGNPRRRSDLVLSPVSPQNPGGTPPGHRSSLEKFEEDSLSGPGHSPPRDTQAQGLGFSHPLPRQPSKTVLGPGVRRARTVDREASRRSGIDWIVPTEEVKELPPRPKTAEERLRPTLDHARIEKDKYALKAKMTGWALNVAIGLQVLLGALTTGLSAATTGRFSTAILGGLATLVASYLARARGSNEPELSITRVKDLEHFIRECEAFVMDNGHKPADAHIDRQIHSLRQRFEDLLGNASGERKLSPPV